MNDNIGESSRTLLCELIQTQSEFDLSDTHRRCNEHCQERDENEDSYVHVCEERNDVSVVVGVGVVVVGD